MKLGITLKAAVIFVVTSALSYGILKPKVWTTGHPQYQRRIYLHSMRSALSVYQNENNGRFPDSGKKGIENLDVLVEGYYILPKDFERYKEDLFYIEGLTINDPPDTVIAGENRARRKYGISYITIDGRMFPAKVPKLLSYHEQEERIARVVSPGIGLLAASLYMILKRKKSRELKHKIAIDSKAE
jgi:hypothetical protein